MNKDELKRELTNVVYMASGIRTGAIQAFEQKDYAGAIHHSSEGISLIEKTTAAYPDMDEIFAPYLLTFYGIRASAQYESGRATRSAEMLQRALRDVEKAANFPVSAYTTRDQRPAMQQLQ
ncbi:MAG: hypothetical protein B6D41_06220 [Chloroflexi bacterium UTCFX4]|nr:MAG: hypothetical protein B6D41_06220 [Chloroflexi bacterium UTCFX4]